MRGGSEARHDGRELDSLEEVMVIALDDKDLEGGYEISYKRVEIGICVAQKRIEFLE